MNKVRRINIPLIGSFAFVRDNGEAFHAGTMFTGHLKADHFRGNRLLESIDLGSGLVTTAGVTLMAQDYTNTDATLKLANYHSTGTGTTAAAIGDTALVTPSGSRVAGTQNNTANVYRSVATVSYSSTLAITEWGLFTASTSGTLWDRRVFAAVNVANGDSINFTYELTISAGG